MIEHLDLHLCTSVVFAMSNPEIRPLLSLVTLFHWTSLSVGKLSEGPGGIRNRNAASIPSHPDVMRISDAFIPRGHTTANTTYHIWPCDPRQDMLSGFSHFLEPHSYDVSSLHKPHHHVSSIFTPLKKQSPYPTTAILAPPDQLKANQPPFPVSPRPTSSPPNPNHTMGLPHLHPLPLCLPRRISDNP